MKKDRKKRDTLLQKTIKESMFLTEILIGDEDRENALLIRFYREELYGRDAKEGEAGTPAEEDGQTSAEEEWQKEEFYIRLLMLLHRTLHPGGNAEEERASAEAVYLLTEEEEKGLRMADTLIRQYYRDRRASFIPDKVRISRIRDAIAA